MAEIYGFPKDFKTGGELISLLFRADRARTAAANLGSDKWPGQNGEAVMSDRVAFNRLGLMFEYLSAYYPESVVTPKEYDAKIVEFAEISGYGPQGLAYSPRFTPVYRFEQQLLSGGQDSGAVNYLISRDAYDPTLNVRQQELIFKQTFDAASGQAKGGYEEEAIRTALSVMDKPGLYIKKHLEESRLAWKKRQWLTRRKGHIAVKHHRLNP